MYIVYMCEHSFEMQPLYHQHNLTQLNLSSWQYPSEVLHQSLIQRSSWNEHKNTGPGTPYTCKT